MRCVTKQKMTKMEKPTPPSTFDGGTYLANHKAHLNEQAEKGLYHPEVGAPPVPVETDATPDD